MSWCVSRYSKQFKDLSQHLSHLSPRCVICSLGDKVLMVALDLIDPIVMVSEDYECEGTIVP